MSKICYWDDQEKIQKERDATSEEQAEIDSRKATSQEINAPLIAALEKIDARSIRALRTGDMNRIEALEAEAEALRLQLVK